MKEKILKATLFIILILAMILSLVNDSSHFNVSFWIILAFAYIIYLTIKVQDIEKDLLEFRIEVNRLRQEIKEVNQND